jgi:hypothetical protein
VGCVSNHPQPRPGEEWRTPEGRTIYVDSVQGDVVMGNATAPAVTSSGELTSSDSMAHYDGHVVDFAGYELVGPRWAMTFTAPAPGEHPSQDPVYEAIKSVASVKKRAIGSVISGAISQGANYEAVVVGLTAEEATEKVQGAAAGYGDVTVLSAHQAL